MDLEVRQHDAFQQREWRAQRVGWGLLGLFVLAGLLGLLGRGPLSSTELRAGSGLLQLEHLRIGHLEADEALTLTVDPRAVDGSSVTLVLQGSWPAAVDIQGIVPEPESQTATPAGLALEFATEPGATLTVQIAYRATEMGRISGAVSLDDDTLDFSTFVLP